MFQIRKSIKMTMTTTASAGWHLSIFSVYDWYSRGLSPTTESLPYIHHLFVTSRQGGDAGGGLLHFLHTRLVSVPSGDPRDAAVAGSLVGLILIQGPTLRSIMAADAAGGGFWFFPFSVSAALMSMSHVSCTSCLGLSCLRDIVGNPRRCRYG